MNAYLVKPTERFMEAADELGLEVSDLDGQYPQLFFNGGPWEIMLVDRERDEDGRRLVLPLAFGSKKDAQQAGQILATAFERVRELQRKPAPDPGTCEHEPEAMRFSRELPQRLICQLCRHDLGNVIEEITGR